MATISAPRLKIYSDEQLTQLGLSRKRLLENRFPDERIQLVPLDCSIDDFLEWHCRHMAEPIGLKESTRNIPESTLEKYLAIVPNARLEIAYRVSDAMRVKRGDLIALLLKTFGIDVISLIPDETTLIHRAAKMGFVSVVRLMLELGVPFDITDRIGENISHAACSGYDARKIIDFLFEFSSGASSFSSLIVANNIAGQSPLMVALNNDSIDRDILICELWKYILPLKEKNIHDDIYHDLARIGAWQAIEMLFPFMPAQLSLIQNGKTAIHAAVSEGMAPVAKTIQTILRLAPELTLALSDPSIMEGVYLRSEPEDYQRFIYFLRALGATPCGTGDILEEVNGLMQADIDLLTNPLPTDFVMEVRAEIYFRPSLTQRLLVAA